MHFPWVKTRYGMGGIREIEGLVNGEIQFIYM